MDFTYWRSTRSPLYSFLFTIPLFVIYEAGIFLTSSEDLLVLRNGADALMRQLLESFGIFGLYGMGAMFLIGFIVIFIFQFKFWKGTNIHGDYLIIMIGESFVWSILIYFLMTNAHLLLMAPTGRLLIQQVTLAVGAGIYEEFLFRVLLIAGISVLLGFIFQWSENARDWMAMVIAAGIFSSFHFIGEYADYFSFEVFMIRFFAGLFLGTLYFLRGFGITAWAHAFYDLIVLTRMTTQ